MCVLVGASHSVNWWTQLEPTEVYAMDTKTTVIAMATKIGLNKVLFWGRITAWSVLQCRQLYVTTLPWTLVPFDLRFVVL